MPLHCADYCMIYVTRNKPLTPGNGFPLEIKCLAGRLLSRNMPSQIQRPDSGQRILHNWFKASWLWKIQKTGSHTQLGWRRSMKGKIFSTLSAAVLVLALGSMAKADTWTLAPGLSA